VRPHPIPTHTESRGFSVSSPQPSREAERSARGSLASKCTRIYLSVCITLASEMHPGLVRLPASPWLPNAPGSAAAAVARRPPSVEARQHPAGRALLRLPPHCCWLPAAPAKQRQGARLSYACAGLVTLGTH
jgi:hypothetical protein